MGTVHLWDAFQPQQRRNIAIYVLGIMLYKFGIESNERFTTSRYEKIAILTGLNYAAQGVGSIAIAPLVKRMPIRTVLFAAVLMFGVVSAMIMIIDSTTGGMPKFKTPDNQVLYGHWNPNLLFPIFTFSGLSYGMVELIRRVIPRDIVGGDPVRLKKMDGFVHVMYESAGTIGALSSERLIEIFGYNYSSFLSPILFSLAAVAWWFLDIYDTNKDELMNESIDFEGKRASPTASIELVVIDRSHKSMTETLKAAFHGFYKAFYYGAWMCLGHRKFVWLIPGYTFALYGHRYLENGVVQIYAKSVLGDSGVAQIIVGGSNLGELLGALCVMIFTNAIPTPLPWLRLDGLSLQLVWLIPFFPFLFGQNAKSTAWILAPCMIPISFGWAGGDCSLGAYIQSTLSKLENQDTEVSALGAVMAFLYVAYIILYSVISTLMGRWVDSQLGELEGEALMQKAKFATKFVGGLHFTILGIIIFSSTFIPRGSLSLNPAQIEKVPEQNDEERADSDEGFGTPSSEQYSSERTWTNGNGHAR